MTDNLLGAERCSTCRRLLLWVDGALRCVAAACPGHDPEAAK